MFADAIYVGNSLAGGCRKVCFSEGISIDQKSGFGRLVPVGPFLPPNRSLAPIRRSTGWSRTAKNIGKVSLKKLMYAG
jgi:hypothetical protein